MYKIMIVDDEDNILKALKRALGRDKSKEIHVFNNARDALRCAQVSVFDLFLSDFRMPEMDGVEFLSAVRTIQPDAMRLLLSGYTDLEALLGAINDANIFRFISKPWDDDKLITTIEQALEYRKALVENRVLADQVRRQQEELDKQKTALQHLEEKHPELFSVNWSTDGSIVIDDDAL